MPIPATAPSLKFRNVVCRPRQISAQDVLVHRGRAVQCDHGVAYMRMCPNPLQQVEPVLGWHLDVQQDKIRQGIRFPIRVIPHTCQIFARYVGAICELQAKRNPRSMAGLIEREQIVRAIVYVQDRFHREPFKANSLPPKASGPLAIHGSGYPSEIQPLDSLITL